MVLYNKLYNIDKFGHKRHLKKIKPIFQYKAHTMGGNKKHEIIRVAQENLFMLKRLNERTSFYNVEKWNKDYEISQVYKRNHCLYAPIDFNKTQRYGGYGNTWGLGKNQGTNSYTTRKQFFSKTHYSGNGNWEIPDNKRVANSTKKRKKFEDFNYRDLQFIEKEKKEEKEEKGEDNLFKKISEIENNEQEQQNDNKEEKKEEKEENGENKKEENVEDKKEEEKEEEKTEEKEIKDEDNEEQREQKKNNRDDKEKEEKEEKEDKDNEQKEKSEE